MEADERERRELAELWDAWRKTREAQKAVRRDAHRRRIACIRENAARTRRKIEAGHVAEIEPMEQSIANLEKRIAELESGIRDTVSTAPSGLPARPRTPGFASQPPTPTPSQATTTHVSHVSQAKVVFRPFMSKWRIKSPQSMATGPKV
jgi:hypothetical protein